eukprot:SAG22_NODE_10881_length_512_cov_0.733656_1_plen_115_part_00
MIDLPPPLQLCSLLRGQLFTPSAHYCYSFHSGRNGTVASAGLSWYTNTDAGAGADAVGRRQLEATMSPSRLTTAELRGATDADLAELFAAVGKIKARAAIAKLRESMTIMPSYM